MAFASRIIQPTRRFIPNSIARLFPQRRKTTPEIVGDLRTNRLATSWYDSNSNTPTRDWGQADYKFWNRVLLGKAQGLELSGLFLKPLASKIASWTLGITPSFSIENENSQTAVNKWFTDNHPAVLRALEESLVKADSYLVVNPDLTLTVLPPDVVKPIVDDNDYSKIIGWTVTEVHPHPTRHMDNMKIVDEYTEKERVRKKYKNGKLQSTDKYPNLLGCIPLIHIANNVGSDETFGHAEGEALINVLHQYGALFDAAIAGNKRQGRPTPVIQRFGSVEEMQQFWANFGVKRTRTLDDGTIETYYELPFDADNVMTLAGNAEFKYESPGSFSADTQTLLGLLFYLMLQHSEVPEFVWGNAIASSQASAETQMPPFVKFIQKKQRQYNWVNELIAVVVGFLSLWEPGINAEDEIAVKYPDLTQKDGKLTLDAIRLALDKDIIDEETALTLMPLEIENPKEVLDKVKDELAKRKDDDDQRQEGLMTRLSDRHTKTDDDDEETADEMVLEPIPSVFEQAFSN
jgi:hypothetical protein